MRKRGKVLRDTNVGPGLLTAEGKQYSFVLEDMWRSEVPPRTGMSVEVEFDSEGLPVAVSAISEGQLAKEQAHKAVIGALRQGESVKTGLAARFGLVSIAAEAVLLLSFFALPNLRVGSAYAGQAVSGWDATGFDPTTMTDHHGLLGLVTLGAVLAPISVTFLRRAWTHWLYAAPLLAFLIALLTISFRIHNAAQVATGAMGQIFGAAASAEMSRQIGGNFSLGFGAYLAFVCSMYLFTQAFKARM